jgi:hypothetical protein
VVYNKRRSFEGTRITLTVALGPTPLPPRPLRPPRRVLQALEVCRLLSACASIFLLLGLAFMPPDCPML